MTCEQLLEAQNAFARTEYANIALEMLNSIFNQMKGNDNEKQPSKIIADEYELAYFEIRNGLSSFEIREEAFNYLEQIVGKILQQGVSKTLDEVQGFLYEKENEFSNLDSAPWISVDDYLPYLNEGECKSIMVLVRYINKESGSASYATDHRYSDASTYTWEVEFMNENNEVTHWSHIPFKREDML